MPTALILGGAACVFKDAEAALELFTPDAVAACNNIGIRWEGRIDHWFSLHVHQWKHPKTGAVEWVGIQEARRRRKLAKLNDPITWSHKPGPGVDRHTSDWTGSTGLLAVKGMLEIGYDRIVLAGVPMTPEQRHFNLEREWDSAGRYHQGWLKNLRHIAPFVRSMSGWTREILGSPESDFFYEQERKDNAKRCKKANG